jgi:hypothetical protein
MVAIEGIRREEERRKQEAEAQRLAEEQANTAGNWTKAVIQVITGDETAIRSAIAGDTKTLLANADSADTTMLILHMTIFMAFIVAGEAGTSAGARAGRAGGRGFGVSARVMPEEVYTEAEARGTPIQRSARTDAMLEDLTAEYNSLSPAEQHRTSIRVLYHRMQYHLQLADEAFAERDMARYELERSTADVLDSARRRHADDLNRMNVEARQASLAERAETTARVDAYLKERESANGLDPYYLNEIEIRFEQFKGRRWESEEEFRAFVDEYIEFRIRYNTYVRQCEALDVEPQTLGDFYQQNGYTNPKDYNDFLRWSSNKMLDDLEAKKQAERDALEPNEAERTEPDETTPLIEDSELDEYHRADPERRQEILRRKSKATKFLEAYEKYRLSLTVAGTLGALPFVSAESDSTPPPAPAPSPPPADTELPREKAREPPQESIAPQSEIGESPEQALLPVLLYANAEINLSQYNFVY